MAVSWQEISLLGGLYLRQVALFAELATTAHDNTVQDSWPLPPPVGFLLFTSVLDPDPGFAIAIKFNFALLPSLFFKYISFL
jgi:hypothetical protein